MSWFKLFQMNNVNSVLIFITLSTSIWQNNVQSLESKNIVGGSIATSGQFTYHVTVYFGSNYCGGAIISPIHVITAAHCVYIGNGKFLPGLFNILAGVVDQKGYSSTRFETPVDKIYLPKQYSRTISLPWPDDIAVLRVKNRFNFKVNKVLSKIKLASNVEDFIGKNATFTGFGVNLLRFPPFFDIQGRHHFDGYYSHKLHYAYAQVLSNEVCNSPNDFSPDFQFCARVIQPSDLLISDGVCRGDSGGPLVYEGYLLGVLSTGPSNCNETLKTGVYTSIPKHINFIYKALKDDCTGDLITCLY